MNTTALTVLHRWSSFDRLLDFIDAHPDFNDRLTVPMLRSQGFTGPGDPSLLRTLQRLEFLDKQHRPTPRWASYHLSPSDTLAATLREHYPGLADLPDWPWLTKATVSAWFQPPHTTSKASNQRRAQASYQRLTRIAESAAREERYTPVPPAHPLGELRYQQEASAQPSPPQLVIQLPALTNQEQWKALLSALRDVFYT